VKAFGILGVFLSGLAGFLAMLAYGKHIALGLSAVIINIVNIIFLSPSLIIAASQQASSSNETSYSTAFGILISIQILAICIYLGVWLKGFLNARA